MSYKLEVTPKLGYLHAVATGENGKDAVIGYLTDLRNECAAHKCWYVLIEERLAGRRLTVRELIEIVFWVPTRGPGRLPSVAWVDQQASPLMMRLGEALATLRGLQVWVFNSVADAEAWLQKVG